MEEQYQGIRVGKIHRKMDDADLNEINSRTSYKKYYADKSISKSQQASEDINDNLSEKANSIHTSYKYHKKNNGNNSISSGCSCNHKNENNQYNDDDSVSMSENDNLICPNCINNVLIEEKQKRNEKDKENNNSNGYFQDYNKNYEKDLIDERRRQREYNTNEAIKNLAKINADLNSKDRLIQENENSRNPFEGGNDYKYQRFQDNYNRKQKMIDDNIDKYFPNKGIENPNIDSYYDNYVYNNNNKNNNINKDSGYKNGINGDNYEKDKKKEEYIKSLEDQINYKNELKKKEREAEKRREQEQYENMQREIKREQEEKFLKEQKQKKELLEANMELINQKNKQKMKELEDKQKYREYYDRENEEYQKELAKKQLEKEKMRNEMYNENRSEYENKKRFKEQERNNDDNNNNQDKIDFNCQNKCNVKERMGRCCRCQRVFPRKMLTINRYFYKENRK